MLWAMNVTLRRLEVFVAVTDTGSFSRAANRLNIAQPSVSAHIRGLEREVGGAVFDAPARQPAGADGPGSQCP